MPPHTTRHQRLDLFVQCVRLSWLSVGFRTHSKSLKFHSFKPRVFFHYHTIVTCHDVITNIRLTVCLTAADVSCLSSLSGDIVWVELSQCESWSAVPTWVVFTALSFDSFHYNHRLIIFLPSDKWLVVLVTPCDLQSDLWWPTLLLSRDYLTSPTDDVILLFISKKDKVD